MKVKSDHLSKFSNLGNWKEEAWKYQGFNGIRNRDLRDTGAMLDQLSCEATKLGARSICYIENLGEDSHNESGKRSFVDVDHKPLISL